MRLSTEQRVALRAHFSHEVGADCEVLLFGSRADDNQRGGDVELLVRLPRPLQRPVWLAARLAAHAVRLLGGRRVDVLLLDPATKLQPIHAAALATGVVL